MFKLAMLATAVVLGLGAADAESVTAEPNLEKRSQLALLQANQSLDAARKAYASGETEQFASHIGEVAAMADLSYKSLLDTGKKARRNPKWFKRTEQSMRTLLRKVESIEKEVSIDDRAVVESARKSISEVHEQLLHDIMTKK
jgi:hypothetical protein